MVRTLGQYKRAVLFIYKKEVVKMLDRQNPYSAIPQLEKRVKELEQNTPSGVVIKDEFTKKLSALEKGLNKKQDKLTAGENIIIDNGTISSVGGDGGVDADDVRAIVESYDYLQSSIADNIYQKLPYEDDNIEDEELTTLLELVFS